MARSTKNSGAARCNAELCTEMSIPSTPVPKSRETKIYDQNPFPACLAHQRSLCFSLLPPQASVLQLSWQAAQQPLTMAFGSQVSPEDPTRHIWNLR